MFGFQKILSSFWIIPENGVVCYSVRMSEFYESEIDRLHEKLAAIYRRGNLTSAEDSEARGLWARIERLEATRAKVVAREFRFMGSSKLVAVDGGGQA